MRFTAHLRAVLDAPPIDALAPEVGALLMVEPLTSFPRPGLRIRIGERKANVLSIIPYDEFFDPNYEGCVGLAVDEHGLEAEGLTGAFIVETSP
ncbi:MAG: hypothetical protein AAF401_14460 [Pseudomonadota bacterium]